MQIFSSVGHAVFEMCDRDNFGFYQDSSALYIDFFLMLEHAHGANMRKNPPPQNKYSNNKASFRT